jgi:polyhydroxybutyrate depolymerase
MRKGSTMRGHAQHRHLLRLQWAAIAGVFALLAGACGAGPAVEPTASGIPTASASAEPTQGARSYDVFVPSGYNPNTPAPLVVMLHGYSTSGAQMERFLGLEPFAEDRGFLYVHPDGTVDTQGNRFWDATDGCCNSTDTPVDDSAYLAGVIDEVSTHYSVDPNRIYLVGSSNGGFMAYRMACDHADTIAAIVSIAAATFLDPTRCSPSEPVSIAEVHGTSDEVIPYDGGILIEHPFPSAPGTVKIWAGYDTCSGKRDPVDGNMDLDASQPGPETSVTGYTRCPPGIDVELWTVKDASHIIPPSADLVPSILDFLFAHPKPQ